MPRLAQVPSFDSIKPTWGDKTAVILGAGPSLTRQLLNRVDGRFNVMAVKDIMFEAKATAGFGLDVPWMIHVASRILETKFPVYLAVPEDLPISWPQFPVELVKKARFLKRMQGPGLYQEADGIHAGGSSGYGALNAVVHAGAKEIILLGFDYSIKTIDQGKSRSPKILKKSELDTRTRRSPSKWGEWANNFYTMAEDLESRGVTVINGSNDSRLKAFKRMPPEEALDYFG